MFVQETELWDPAWGDPEGLGLGIQPLVSALRCLEPFSQGPQA